MNYSTSSAYSARGASRPTGKSQMEACSSENGEVI
jgi:hypothetical protein